MAEPRAAKPKTDDGARPRVVLIVRERPAGAAAPAPVAAPALTPEAEPEAVAVADPAVADPAVADPAVADPVVASAEGAIGDAKVRISVPPRPLPSEDRPTERIRKETRRRDPEDEAIVAAVIPVVLGGAPTPLDDFLGRSLLFRAARAAQRIGAPRLILLVGKADEATRRRLHDEAYAGFGGKPVELRDGDPIDKDFGRGRVLVLDGCALHDPESVRRLAQTRGANLALLLSEHGDGLRVSTEGGRVRQVGLDVASADGCMTGAALVPVEHFERITRVGERAALEELIDAESLVGVPAPRNYGRQFRGREDFEAARRDAFDALASGGPSGSFDDAVGRPISRGVTMAMLHRPAFTPARVSLLAGVLALVGAFALAASGVVPGVVGRLVGVLAGLLLVASAVFDRADGELARLRLDADEDARYLDFGLDHLAHAVVFLALAFQVQTSGALDAAASRIPQLESLLRESLLEPAHLGQVAFLGVVILMCVLLWRGAPRPDAQGLRRVADSLANAFNSRDYFYLLTIAAVLNCVPLLWQTGVMGLFLLVTTALVHLLWVVLLLLNLVAPAPEE